MKTTQHSCCTTTNQYLYYCCTEYSVAYCLRVGSTRCSGVAVCLFLLSREEASRCTMLSLGRGRRQEIRQTSDAASIGWSGWPDRYLTMTRGIQCPTVLSSSSSSFSYLPRACVKHSHSLHPTNQKQHGQAVRSKSLMHSSSAPSTYDIIHMCIILMDMRFPLHCCCLLTCSSLLFHVQPPQILLFRLSSSFSIFSFVLVFYFFLLFFVPFDDLSLQVYSSSKQQTAVQNTLYIISYLVYYCCVIRGMYIGIWYLCLCWIRTYICDTHE